jgi:hypothetical protein
MCWKIVPSRLAIFKFRSSAIPIMTTEKHDAPAASNTSDSDLEIVPGSINEKKLLRTLDLRLLPAVSILYLLSFLDRSNGTPSSLQRDPGTYLTLYSGQCPYRRFNEGSRDDRQSVPHWPDSLLHWLRPLRNPVQHRPQAHNAQILASNAYISMGGCRNIDGCNAESARILCCAVLVGDPRNDERDI